MSRSAVFADRLAHRSRITTLTEEEHLLELLMRALDVAGYEMESAEEGVDTPFDIAATSPDLVIIGVAAATPAAGVHAMVRNIVEHPHLRHVPVVVYAPRELVAVPMDLPEHSVVELMPRFAGDTEVEEITELIDRWTRDLLRQP
jgi:hypothetical protein